MEFKSDFLLLYMSKAPLALAFERYLECRILQTKKFERPILDLGCGDGLFSYILFNEKIDTGIDPNHKELQRASHLDNYVELIECTGDTIPKPDGYYSTIFSNSVLEHIQDLDPVFKEIYRVIGDNGRVYITIPSKNFEQYTFINLIMLRLGLSGLASTYRKFCSRVIWKQYHYRTIEEWQVILKNSGFEVVDAFTYDDCSICLLNNFLYPFGLFGLLNKKIFQKWILFPEIRRFLMYPLYLACRSFLNHDSHDNGGLLFLELKKEKYF
jgi:ubiquinone/menaquinone biosynthesis C-methylase UbiE